MCRLLHSNKIDVKDSQYFRYLIVSDNNHFTISGSLHVLVFLLVSRARYLFIAHQALKISNWQTSTQEARTICRKIKWPSKQRSRKLLIIKEKAILISFGIDSQFLISVSIHSQFTLAGMFLCSFLFCNLIDRKNKRKVSNLGLRFPCQVVVEEEQIWHGVTV
ncbi:hypothetical protein Peur_002599 [Populus x canadensis]